MKLRRLFCVKGPWLRSAAPLTSRLLWPAWDCLRCAFRVSCDASLSQPSAGLWAHICSTCRKSSDANAKRRRCECGPWRLTGASVSAANGRTRNAVSRLSRSASRWRKCGASAPGGAKLTWKRRSGRYAKTNAAWQPRACHQKLVQILTDRCVQAPVRSAPPRGRKYCVPRTGSLTRCNNSRRSWLSSTKSISEVFTTSRSEAL